MYTVVAAGEAAVVGYSTAGGAVVVNCGAAGRQQGVGVAAGRSSKILVSCRQSSNGQTGISCGVAAVCPGGSTVPAAVVIVVKHRARLSVG